LKTNLWAAQAQHKIEDYSYEFIDIVDGKHFTDKDLLYNIKIFTNLNKQELENYLNGCCNNSESYKIL